MFHWALVLLVIGVVASLLGFGGLAGAAIGVAKGLVIFKVLGIILVLAGLFMLVRHNRSDVMR